MRNKINSISSDVGIPAKKVVDFLYVLKDGKAIENNELIRKIGVSRNVLNQIKEEFEQILKPASNSTQLKEINKEIDLLVGNEYKTEEDLWKNLENSESYKKALDLLKKIENYRPVPERKYDQFTATLETTAKRVALMNYFSDIAGKKLLFLGDDDFTSIAAATLDKADDIVVADIDTRITDKIKKISDEYNLRIKIQTIDFRKKLPEVLNNQFDVVFTDPPYTPEGIELFVSRGIESLYGKNNAVRIYVCYGNSDRAKERYLPIYKIFIDSGLMIRWIFDKFNRYKGAESIGSTSSIFILDKTPKTKSLVNEDYGKKPIYTNN